MERELNDVEFLKFLAPFSDRLCELAQFAAEDDPEWPSSQYVGIVLSLATRLEEFVDYSGAKNNSRWFPFRECIASVKMFANVSYIAMHIRSASPHYKLAGNIEGFLRDTGLTLSSLVEGLRRSLLTFSKFGKEYGLVESDFYHAFDFKLPLPSAALPKDRIKPPVKDREAVVVNMATAFLNLFTETEIHDLSEEDPSEYPRYIPDQISESSLRDLEVQFHNLQSVYDTRLADTNIESVDARLPLIRGHASIIYHLLELATNLIHYYERHMSPGGKTEPAIPLPMSREEVLRLVFRYSLSYADQFLEGSISLCREVIASYAEYGEIEVPVPNYRGFHVRPSTLVAKIVQHYGSNVSLDISDLECDAGLPLELFRVNEKINAEKRKRIAKVVSELDVVDLPPGLGQPRDVARAALSQLAERNQLISYNINLEPPELEKAPEESYAEYVNRVIAQLLAEGSIDIRTDLTVKFRGDKRVLKDLKSLAECGYGEDDFGNNIMLPSCLSYLKR